jgi:hypothetical protein
MTKHPMQPLVRDEHGTARFKGNAIVRFLLDNGPHNLNSIARRKDFSQEDRDQFAQLIGYSRCGFCDLSYVSEEAKDAADAMKVSDGS